MSSSKIELKGITLEMYKEKGLYPDIPFVFSLHYCPDTGNITCLPIEEAKKHYCSAHLTSVLLEILCRKESTAAYLVKHRHSIYILPAFSRSGSPNEHIRCLLRGKERLNDEITKAHYKHTLFGKPKKLTTKEEFVIHRQMGKTGLTRAMWSNND